jgi:hypothetical protein
MFEYDETPKVCKNFWGFFYVKHDIYGGITKVGWYILVLLVGSWSKNSDASNSNIV